MTTELAIHNSEEVQMQRPASFHAVAVNATEMAESNIQIRAHVAAKLDALKLELEEISEASMIAETNKWDNKALAKVGRRLLKQVTYYEKLVIALDSGFTLVPNMPCDQFAIRVSRKGPAAPPKYEKATWRPNEFIPDEKEQTLPAGDGRYESVKQLVEVTRNEELVEGKRMHEVSVIPVGFDMIEFPFAAAVPVVMTATQAAMALKLFDRIGIVPQQVRSDQDPIILGQIVFRHNGSERVTSFLIAWHLDLRTL